MKYAAQAGLFLLAFAAGFIFFNILAYLGQ